MQIPYSPIVQKATLQMNSGRHGWSTPTLGLGIKLLAYRQDLRHQALDTITFIRLNPATSTDTAFALLHRLAHQSEAAMARSDIESIEKQDIRRRYVGKQAPRTSRKKLSAKLVVGGREWT